MPFYRFLAAILDFGRHLGPHDGNSLAALQETLEGPKERLWMVGQTFASIVTPTTDSRLLLGQVTHSHCLAPTIRRSFVDIWSVNKWYLPFFIFLLF